MAEDAENSIPAPEDLEFKMIAEIWLEWLRGRVKPATYEKYRIVYNKYLADVLGNCPVSEVTETLLKDGIPGFVSGSLQKSIYSVTNQILIFADHKFGAVVHKLERPSSKVKKKPIKVLSQSEQAKMFAVLYCHMDIYKMSAALCLYTGLRIGELCALKWSDIDLENRIIHVCRTVQRLSKEGGRSKTELVENSPKSECSRREIPVSASALALLLKFSNDSIYVFGGNKPMEPRTLQYRFKKHLKEAGLSDKNFHILRHTFATNCIESGADVKSLSEILGHSNVQITLNRYVHPTMDSKRRHMEGLSRLYGQILGQAV